MGVGFSAKLPYGPVVVAAIHPNSPAAKGGVQIGDTIVAANGVAIDTPDQLKHAIGRLDAGHQVRLSLRRGGNSQPITVTIQLVGELPPYEMPFLGILPMRNAAGNVVVRWVYPGSSAALAQVKEGDRIVGFGQQPVATVDALREHLASLRPGEDLTLDVVEAARESPVNRTVSLGRQPTQFPVNDDMLPDASREDAPAADDELARGEIAIKLADVPGECVGYAPVTARRARPAGLLIHLVQPGDTKAKELVQSWKTVCDQFGLILLCPQSQDKDRWVPEEEEIVGRQILQVMGQYPVDPNRVVVMGQRGAGSMAYLLASELRDTVRGVVTIDGMLPRGITLQSEPLRPLAIVQVIHQGESRTADRLQKESQALRKLGFPVSLVEQTTGKVGQLPDRFRDQLGQWIDTLDRL